MTFLWKEVSLKISLRYFQQKHLNQFLAKNISVYLEALVLLVSMVTGNRWNPVTASDKWGTTSDGALWSEDTAFRLLFEAPVIMQKL